MFKSLDHVSNSYEIYRFTTFPRIEDTLSCFKQIYLNFIFPLPQLQIISGSKLLPVVDRGVILSSDIFFNCHEPILLFLDVKDLENG